MLNLNEFYNQAINYEAYIEKTEDQLEDLVEQGDPEGYVQYYSMGLQRMNRINKTFQFDQMIEKELEKVEISDLKFLTITEGWCGDASQIVPVVHQLAQKLNIENRYISRDENLNLMENYKTNGSISIPIVIGLNGEGEEVFRFGPRPQHGMDLLKQHKENPDKYSKDDFHEDLQQYYNSNKGKDIVNEILALIP